MGKVNWRQVRNGVFFSLIMLILMSILSLSLHGCASVATIDTRSVKPLPLFCEVQTAYRPPRKELQHVAKASYTLDYLLRLNTYGKKMCHWKENG